MATVRGRKRADGTPSNTAQIRIKKNGAQVYTESQTFARKKAAEAWAERRETELGEPGALERASEPKSQLKDVIKQYLEEAGKAQPLGRTKESTLERIADSYLGEMTPAELTSQLLCSGRHYTPRSSH